MTTPTAAQQKKEQEKQALYVELQKFCQSQDDTRAIKVASKILHLFPNDEVAFKTKIVCHVNRGMFAEALSLINDTSKLSGSVQYEKAYCLYRLQRMEEAKSVLDSWQSNSFKKVELMYQIHYRLDNFESAYDSLSDLLKTSDDEMDDERRTNLSAIAASLKLAGSSRRVKDIQGDSYEMLYNHAVGLIGEGKIVEAEKLLQQAENLAKETLQEEGASEEDMVDELALIECQHAYCIQVLGRVKEALGMYSKILKDKPSDIGLTAVISNNILCGNKDCSIFDSKKRLRVMTMDEVLLKMNNMQRRDMLLNECLFDLHIHHAAETERLCALVETRYPELAEDVLMIRCCLKTWTENIIVARKEFIAKQVKGSDSWLKISLGLIQIALENDYTEPAINFMKELGDHYYRPGIVSAIVTLYHHRGKFDKAGQVLKEALDFHRKSGANNVNLKLIWRHSASFMMAQGDHEGAARSLEELRKTTNDSDPLVLAQLIVAYSQINVEKAKSLSKLLPPIATSNVDGQVLESPNWLAHVKMFRKGLKPDSAPTPAKYLSTDGKDKPKKSKSKKKKAKIPANFDPDRQPDPERWLSKYERSGYRPKKTRKGRVDVGKGTQGADSTASAIYDMTSKVGAKGQTTADDSPASSSSAWKKDQSKKKKRKK